jgi:hypothetical protein
MCSAPRPPEAVAIAAVLRRKTGDMSVVKNQHGHRAPPPGRGRKRLSLAPGKAAMVGARSRRAALPRRSGAAELSDAWHGLDTRKIPDAIRQEMPGLGLRRALLSSPWPLPARGGPKMNWLVRHIDWALVGVAVSLSVVWIGDYMMHPHVEPLPMAVINDGYVPPKAPLPRPFIPGSPTFS